MTQWLLILVPMALGLLALLYLTWRNGKQDEREHEAAATEIENQKARKFYEARLKLIHDTPVSPSDVLVGSTGGVRDPQGKP